MIPLCRYILQGGNQCQQAAFNGEYYCRHHLVVRRTVAANTPKQNPYRVDQVLPLIFPEDRAALQLDIFVVMQAFNQGTIGPKSANIFTRLLHECSINLKQGPLYDANHDNAVRNVVVTPEGEEIAPPREVPEDCASSNTRFAHEDEAITEEVISNEAVIDKTIGGETAGSKTAGIETASSKTACSKNVSEEPASEEAANERKASAKPPAGPTPPWDQSDFACADPCYIANLTERREQYREFALKDLAAGRDPRDWDDFIPGKSKSRRPAPIPSLKR